MAGSMLAFATLSKPPPEGCQALLLSEWTRSCLQCQDAMAGKSGGEVRLEDLKAQAFVGASRGLSLRRMWIVSCQRHTPGGLSPNIVQEAIDERTLLSLVSAGIGIGFCNSAHEGRKPQLVDLVPVDRFRPQTSALLRMEPVELVRSAERVPVSGVAPPGQGAAHLRL